MDTPSSKKKPLRFHGPSFAAVVALGMTFSGGLLAPRPAQAYFASEITQIQNNISLLMNQVQDYTAYGKDIQRWRQQAQDMAAQLNSLAAVVGSFGMPASSAGALKKVDPAKVVRDRCGQGGSVMSRLLGSFSINPDGDIAGQQAQLCSAITTLETHRYNESVGFINDTLPKLQADLKKINSARNSNKDKSGVAGGLEVDVNTIMAKYNGELKGWEAQIGLYDKSIEGLKAQQRLLSHIALTGSRNGGVVGQVGKTLILKQALGQ